MNRVWFIVGEPNTRKSSTVRALTGARVHTHCVEIEQKNGLIFTAKTFLQAAQESNPPRSYQDIVDIIKNVDHEIFCRAQRQITPFNLRWGSVNLLLPLRYNGTASAGLDAQNYVDEFISHGWNVEALVSLGENSRPWVQAAGIRHGSIPNSRELATNRVAKIAASMFEWI